MKLTIEVAKPLRGRIMDQLKLEAVRHAFEKTEGDLTKASCYLGVSRPTMKHYATILKLIKEPVVTEALPVIDKEALPKGNSV